MWTIFLHDTAIRTQTNTTTEIGTGITISLPHPAVGEETPTRTTMIPATRMIMILNLLLPAVDEEIRTRTFVTVEPGTGTIRSLFNILTPREARSQGVVILDTGTGRLPRFPNTATTHTHATVIDGTGPGTLLSYLWSTPQVMNIAGTGIETLLYPRGPTTHPGLTTPHGMITICGLIALRNEHNWGLGHGRTGFGASSARSSFMHLLDSGCNVVTWSCKYSLVMYLRCCLPDTRILLAAITRSLPSYSSPLFVSLSTLKRVCLLNAPEPQ